MCWHSWQRRCQKGQRSAVSCPPRISLLSPGFSLKAVGPQLSLVGALVAYRPRMPTRSLSGEWQGRWPLRFVLLPSWSEQLVSRCGPCAAHTPRGNSDVSPLSPRSRHRCFSPSTRPLIFSPRPQRAHEDCVDHRDSVKTTSASAKFHYTCFLPA